jgi:hypothetical protein
MLAHYEPYLISIALTIDTDAYSANDVVAGSTLGYVTTTSPIPQIAGGGFIAWMKLVDDGGLALPVYVYVYNAAPSTIADDAGFAPVEADHLKLLGCVSIAAADYDQTGDDSYALVAGKDVKYQDYIFFPTLVNKLYFRLVAVGANDWTAADDLTFQCMVMLR